MALVTSNTGSAASVELSVQASGPDISAVASKLTEIIGLSQSLFEITSLYELEYVLKELYANLADLKTIYKELPSVLPVANNLSNLVILKSNLDSLKQVAEAITTLDSLFSSLPVLKNIHSALEDLHVLGRYITNVSAKVVMLPSNFEASVNISENAWTFNLPRGNTGLTPSPSFNFDAVSGQLQYSVNYSSSDASALTVFNKSIVSLEEAMSKAAEKYLYNISSVEARATTQQYLEVYLEGLVQNNVYDFLTWYADDKVDVYTNQYLVANVPFMAREYVNEYLMNIASSLKSTVPGPTGEDGLDGINGSNGYSPNISLYLDKDFVIRYSCEYQRDIVPVSVTGQFVYDIKDSISSNVEHYLNQNVSMFKGSQGVGIDSISRVGSTLSFNLSNQSSYSFEVTNGVDGKNGAVGAPGADGKDGLTPVISFNVHPTTYILSYSITLGSNVYYGDLLDIKSVVQDVVSKSLDGVVTSVLTSHADLFKSTVPGPVGPSPKITEFYIDNAYNLNLVVDSVALRDSSKKSLKPADPKTIKSITSTPVNGGLGILVTTGNFSDSNADVSSQFNVYHGSDGRDGINGKDGNGLQGITAVYDAANARTQVSLEMSNGKITSFYVYDGVTGLVPSVTIYNSAGVIKYNVSYSNSGHTIVNSEVYDLKSEVVDFISKYLATNANALKGKDGVGVSSISILSAAEAESLLGIAAVSDKLVYIKFVKSNNEIEIRSLAALTFDSLTQAQKDSLKGEKGADGQNFAFTGNNISFLSRIEVIDDSAALPDSTVQNLGRLVSYKGQTMYLSKITDVNNVVSYVWELLVMDYDDDRILGNK